MVFFALLLHCFISTIRMFLTIHLNKVMSCNLLKYYSGINVFLFFLQRMLNFPPVKFLKKTCIINWWFLCAHIILFLQRFLWFCVRFLQGVTLYQKKNTVNFWNKKFIHKVYQQRALLGIYPQDIKRYFNLRRFMTFFFINTRTGQAK